MNLPRKIMEQMGFRDMAHGDSTHKKWEIWDIPGWPTVIPRHPILVVLADGNRLASGTNHRAIE
jgi:hypothetical protein